MPVKAATMFSCRPLRLAFVGALAFLVTGCGVAQSVRDLSPFGGRETPLPGERQEVQVSGQDYAPNVAERRTVAVPAAFANIDWAQPGGFPTNAVGHLAYSGSLSPAWRSDIGQVGRRGRPPTAPPIVYQGRIFAIDSRSNITGLDATSGGQIWRVSLKPEGEGRHGATGGGLAADNGVLYAATGFGTVAALNLADGGVIWSSDLGVPVRSAPTVSNGRVFFVSADNEVFAYNAADGSELWSFRGIPETAGFMTSAAPAVADGRVVVPFTSGEVISFSAESGEPNWVDALTRSGRISGVTGINDVAARPVIDRGVVYAVSVSGRMIAVSLSNGERLWTRNIASAYTPVVAGEVVYVVSFDGNVFALDRSNGEPQWVTELPKESRKSEAWAGPVLAGNRLWVASSRGRMVSLDPATGAVTGDSSVSGPVSIPPIVASGKLYVLDNNGNLNAFN